MSLPKSVSKKSDAEAGEDLGQRRRDEDEADVEGAERHLGRERQAEDEEDDRVERDLRNRIDGTDDGLEHLAGEAEIAECEPDREPARERHRQRAWLVVGDLERRDSSASPSNVVFDTLADDLIVAYGEDRPNYIRYVVATDLKKAGIQRDKLRTLAIENLRQILGRVRFLEIDGTYRAHAGGVYEASLLLLPDMWTRDRFRVRGEIVVALPTRDLLLVTGSEDAKGLASIRAIVKDRFDRGAYGISPNLYVYRDGKLTKFAD